MNGKRHTPLKEPDLIRMRQLRADGMKMQDIADEMHITISAVSKILSGAYVHTTALPHITPEMMVVWTQYQAHIAELGFASWGEMSRFQADLWYEFARLMEGKTT